MRPRGAGAFAKFTASDILWSMRSFGIRGFRRIGLLRLMPAVVVLSVGCSSFNREWKETRPDSGESQGLEGRWEGQWISEVNHHHGRLRCIVKKENEVYQARFHARYRKILRFGYTVPLKAEPVEPGYKFRGDANLGALAGGIYHYDGHADGSNFFSSYSSQHDHGTFQMQRR